MDTISLDGAYPNFRREIAERRGGEKISACFICRTCVASCPISVVNAEFQPLRIIRMALYGLREEVLKSDEKLAADLKGLKD